MTSRESLTPTSTNQILYLRSDIPLGELIESAKEHFTREWPNEDFELDNYDIGHEHFHARCIGYDLYDRSDYDDYITVSRNC